MAGGRWRIASGIVLVPVAVAGVAGCSGGSGTSSAAATSSASAAVAKANGGLSAAELRSALLTRVNGVAAGPASSGSYSSLTAGAAKSTSGAQITPKACSGVATSGFDASSLSASPAAAVTFKVGTNGVSEVLIASSAASATSALAGHIPAQCATYEESAGGKTFKYGVTEKAVSGVGKQAKVLNVRAIGTAGSDDLWTMIYTGKGFVGTVTVVGPNASEAAVRELGQASYGYAAKELS